MYRKLAFVASLVALCVGVVGFCLMERYSTVGVLTNYIAQLERERENFLRERSDLTEVLSDLKVQVSALVADVAQAQADHQAAVARVPDIENRAYMKGYKTATRESEYWDRVQVQVIRILGNWIYGLIVIIAFGLSDLIRGVVWIFKACYGSSLKRMCNLKKHFGKTKFIQEKFKEGSDYFEMDEPKFQFTIWGKKDINTWVFVGNGFRYGQFAMTVNHNVNEFKDLCLKKGDKKYELKAGDFVSCEHEDIAYADVPASVWSSLNVKGCKFPNQVAASKLVATVCSQGIASTGMLEPYTNKPYLIYNGSTKGGFSGSPIFSGSTVLAMHVGASSVNIAIDAAFLKAVVSLKKESSEDFVYDEIRKNFRQGKKTEYRNWGPDEIYVISGGKYVALVAEDLDADLWGMLQSCQEEGYRRENALPSVEFNDRESFLDLRQPEIVKAAKKLKTAKPIAKEEGVCVVVPPSSAAPVAAKPPTVEEIVASSLQKQTEVMAGLASTLVQLKGVLESTSTSRPLPAPQVPEPSRVVKKRNSRQRKVESSNDSQH